MSKIKLSIPAFVFLLVAFCYTGRAQQFEINPIYYTIFDQDSLSGFNESEARAIAIHERFLGSEFKIKMYRLKRDYINQKYGLTANRNSYQNTYFAGPLSNARPAVVPGCMNEDFEASSAAVITATNQVAGWSVFEGYNGYLSPGDNSYFPGGLSNPTSCNLLGCCPMPPSHSEIIDCSAPGGYIDNTIGSQYPIFSVFGTGTVSGAAASNSQITQGMFGTKVLRLNDENTGDYSMAKLAKTFSVNAQNALFQFAFISVFAPGHGCCDAGGFQIKLYDNGPASNGTPTTIACPSFSVSAPSSQCTATVPMTYYIVQSWNPHTSSNYNNIYNPWKISSMDLSYYLNHFITIEIIVSDCNAGGHFGCVYFDAQCGPMTVYGNGNAYDAGSNVVVPTCGAAGATICAADGLGPYSWAGSGLTPDQGVPSMTNQCITTTISTTYTLYMQPQGACNPISRVVQSSITPAPLLLISGAQAQCGSTLAVVNVTPSGSAMNPSSLIWSPTPLSLNSATTSGQYYVPLTGGGGGTLVSVTAADPLGCKVTATINVNPAPPIPTFTINNVTNAASLTCVTPSIDLAALTTYTYGTLDYFWASASSTYSTQNINVVNPGVFTVVATDPVTQCAITNTYAIGVNTVAPTSNASPMFQNITCGNASAANVTLTSTGSTVNITQSLVSPSSSGNGTFISTSATVSAPVPAPGEYIYCVRNDENGCTTCKTITVTTSDAFPSFNLSSLQNFTLGCASKSFAVVDIINGQGGGGGVVNYTLMPPNSNSVTPSFTSNTSYTVTTPGTYTVIVQDDISLCETRTPISILANTFTPHRAVNMDRQILSCWHPAVTLVGTSTTSSVDYVWNFPFAPGSKAKDSLTVNTLTASTTNSVVGVFTLNVTNTINACQSQTLVTIFQNLYKPTASINGIKSITCKTPTVTLVNQSATSIPPNTFPNTSPITGMWVGPSPQEAKDSSSSYVAGVPGIYTMTAIDKANGCSSTTVFTVDDGRIVPNLQPITNSQLLCGQTSGTVSFTSDLPDNKMDITWKAMEGASTPTISNPKTRVFSVTQTGSYIATVINTDNGCAKTITVPIVPDSLTADFTMDKETGFAPLTVNFTNTSFSSNKATATASINALWNFGNGDSTYQKSTSYTVSPVKVFKQPGTYTVTLYINRGTCMEKVSKVVKVDIPSSVSIPNIFTPNGDGVNDLYFIKSANLTDVNAVIYDRWGHVVYELKNEKGRIEWDGKNQYGKDCAEGTYFYLIKATGADGSAYDEKGTITLVR